MWSRELLKTNAKMRLSRYHWYGVLVCFLAGLLGVSSSGVSFNFETSNSTLQDFIDEFGGGTEETFFIGIILMLLIVLVVLISLAFQLLVTNPTRIGFARYFISSREVKTPVSELFSSFRSNYVNAILTMFMHDLYIFLWSLLLVIPGIIKSYAYYMVPYLLAENPDMDYRRALQLSSEMMDGHKLELFVLQLSFLGWDILSVFTVGILGLLYVEPYRTATMAEFYVAVRSDAMTRGITNNMELPFVFT